MKDLFLAQRWFKVAGNVLGIAEGGDFSTNV
jgi:hypothetical protein